LTRWYDRLARHPLQLNRRRKAAVMVSTVLLMAMIVVGMTVAPSPPGVEQLVVSLLIAILMMVGIGEWLCRSAPHAVET
jgi:hypothetical protein